VVFLVEDVGVRCSAAGGSGVRKQKIIEGLRDSGIEELKFGINHYFKFLNS
jgi:hypothetical protein